MSTLLSTPEGEAGDHAGMAGSNVLVNILKPVNIVNLGNTLRCGVGKSGLGVLSHYLDLTLHSVESHLKLSSGDI